MFTAASQVGNRPVALAALKKFVALNPTTPLLKDVQKICKQLGGSCALKQKAK